jgi:hypothetical protein
MTARQILVRILAEVSGQPEAYVHAVLAALPQTPGLDRTYAPEEAERLLTDLRAEKAGIHNWPIEGARKARRRIDRITAESN